MQNQVFLFRKSWILNEAASWEKALALPPSKFWLGFHHLSGQSPPSLPPKLRGLDGVQGRNRVYCLIIKILKTNKFELKLEIITSSLHIAWLLNDHGCYANSFFSIKIGCRLFKSKYWIYTFQFKSGTSTMRFFHY